VIVYNTVTWGFSDRVPPDVPVCGFNGELCETSTNGGMELINKTHYTHFYKFFTERQFPAIKGDSQA
jgi:hypothetical protein